MGFKQTFGEYLKSKRLERQFTLRKFAQESGISPAYLCDIEKDRIPAPVTEKMKRMASLLSLNSEELNKWADLAAASKSRPAVSNDLPEYIMENDIVRIALRTAKDAAATDEEWQEFIEKVKQRTIKAGDKPPGSEET